MKDSENVCSRQQLSDEQDAAIRIVVPFKDQKSANAARHQLGGFSRTIDADVWPLFQSEDQRTIQTKGTNYETANRCLSLQVVRFDTYLNE